jgi:hypothetical protein
MLTMFIATMFYSGQGELFWSLLGVCAALPNLKQVV